MLGGNGISSKKSSRVVRGQLLLPTQGPTGGILIGGDAKIYRSDINQFRTADDFIFAPTAKLLFRDVALFISSADDGHLDIDADGSVDMNTPVVVLTLVATGSLPAGPEGAIAYDSTLNKLVVYTGAAWETVTSV